MLCRCHRSFNMKLAVVVTVSASGLDVCLPHYESLKSCRSCESSLNLLLLAECYLSCMQAAQALACICMAVSASIALVFLYFLAVMRCNRDIHSGRYCFQLKFT